MLRAQVFQLVRRGRGELVAADDKAFPGGHVEPEIGTVRNHVEGLVAHHRVEPDDADIGGFAEQDVAADVLIFGDAALLGAAERGGHIHGGAEIVHAGVEPGDTVDQRGFVGGKQRLRGSAALARDHAPPDQARSRSSADRQSRSATSGAGLCGINPL